MTNEKMTNKKALVYVIENCEVPSEVKEKVEKMIEALDKKSSNRSTKPSKTQEANAELKAILTDFMANNEKMTVSETIKNCSAVSDLSNQKVSRLLNDLVKDGVLDKNVEKGKTYFFSI